MSETSQPEGTPKEPNVVKKQDLTYNDYLKVAELLELQIPQSEPAHHDEMLFIIIHQTYELWFKLILHEIEQAKENMLNGQVLRARHFVHRVVEIMRVLVQQIHILETMAPVEFLEFRDRLMPASGFQSQQFREMEFASGLKDTRYLKFFEKRPEVHTSLQRRILEPDLRDHFYSMLRKMDFPIPADVARETIDNNEETREALLDAIKPIYQDPEGHMSLYLLAESLVSFDQYLSLWRYHHVRVVERVLGAHKKGTGGSSGVGYLERTTSKKCFPCLWDVRSRLSRPVRE